MENGHLKLGQNANGNEVGNSGSGLIPSGWTPGCEMTFTLRAGVSVWVEMCF